MYLLHRIIFTGLIFISWELNAQVALPTFQATHYASFALYSFSSHTFTNCGITGRTGPTLANCKSSYDVSWEDDTDLFNVETQGIQEWTVPESSTYTIEVWGASTPDQNYSNSSNDHGLGARMKGDFNLTMGDVLQILVGQKPGQSEFNGGGGGTFVAKGTSHTNATALIVAGGGGSHRTQYSASGYEDKLDAVTTTSGVTTYHAGGTNGGGGSARTADQWGGGSGAGFIGNGEGPSSNNGETGVSYSFRNGGVGANFVYSNRGDQEGGFGGGGCGGWGGSGGGGGYSGGGGGKNGSGLSAQGGGGGSYNSGSNQDNSAGAWEGHGKVTITKN
jgi:hypothetical protein